MRHWRSSLAGGVLITGVVAWVLDAHLSNTSLWIWMLLGWLCFVALGLLCFGMERASESSKNPLLLHLLTLVLPACSGVVWGSLPWWLPGDDTEVQLLAALLIGVVVIGASNSVASKATLFAWVIPVGLIMPAALAWHADFPAAAVSVLLVMLLILRYGLLLLQTTQEIIRQRQRAESLYSDLNTQQARLRALERSQTLATERERLMLDMHDGLGSRLTTALAVIERGRAQPEELAEVLRECIDDLRAVIDSLEPANNDLVNLLATLRFRFGQRLEMAGIAVEWQVEDLPPLMWMGPPEALQVMRIVQELFTNIIKHASARRVVVTTRQVNDDVELEITDDGRGFDPSAPTSGRGVRFLKQRVEKLRGRLEIISSPRAGTRVRLWLPIRPATLMGQPL